MDVIPGRHCPCSLPFHRQQDTSVCMSLVSKVINLQYTGLLCCQDWTMKWKNLKLCSKSRNSAFDHQGSQHLYCSNETSIITFFSSRIPQRLNTSQLHLVCTWREWIFTKHSWNHRDKMHHKNIKFAFFGAVNDTAAILAWPCTRRPLGDRRTVLCNYQLCCYSSWMAPFCC